eukprot:scaffold12009_cov101-Isochrysis_galbana.AAC.3
MKIEKTADATVLPFAREKAPILARQVSRIRANSFSQPRPVSRAWFSPSSMRCLRPCTPPVRVRRSSLLGLFTSCTTFDSTDNRQKQLPCRECSPIVARWAGASGRPTVPTRPMQTMCMRSRPAGVLSRRGEGVQQGWQDARRHEGQPVRRHA